MSVLKNVEVRWASVLKPNTKYTPRWEVELVMTAAQKEELNNEAKKVWPKGAKITQEGDSFIYRVARKTVKKDGSANPAPLVCGPKGKDDLFTQNIGNGSICNIQYGFAVYDNAFGKGLVSDLKGVQVMHHVPYGVQDGDEFEAVEDNSPKSDTEEFDDEDFS